MTFDEACDEAERVSREDMCAMHVNGRIRCIARLDGSLEPVIDPQGWSASDWWCDDSTAVWYSSGERHYR